MGIKEAITQVAGRAEELRNAKTGANEANTKALLVEPMLRALGWDTEDLGQVEREFRVFDNTSLDYALKVEGLPRLVVEAKAVNRDLADKSFIAQTINYANNEGVLWCVLTNGLAYRVYKTNEPVGMEQKLLFEVDLTEGNGEDFSEIAQSLELIGREALIAGNLDLWGDRVFTDTRIRHALSRLAAQPSERFLGEIQAVVGLPEVPLEALTESLARVLDADSSGQRPAGRKPAKSWRPQAGGKQYELSHHLAKLPTAITDRFEQVDEFARGLGPGVSRRIRKQYIGYFGGKGRGKSFCTIETQRRRVVVYLGLDPDQTQPWNSTAMRDVRNVGHFGMGDVEYSIRPDADLEEVEGLIRQAFERL